MARLIPVLAGLLLAAPAAAGRGPNVVIILADDLGYSDLGCYGGEIATPRLDRLAAEGLRFSQFYNCAKCAQTRATLLAGVDHHRTRNLAVPNHVTLAEVLRDRGYATMMVGKWHLAGTPSDRGFDRFFGFLAGGVNYFTGASADDGSAAMRLDRAPWDVPEHGFYLTDALTDRAIGFVDEALRDDRPFFLYVAHYAPHLPLQALPEDVERYDGVYDDGWDAIRAARYDRLAASGLLDPAWGLAPRDPAVAAWESLSPPRRVEEARLMAVYAAMVDRLDRNVGRLLDHLEARDVAPSTLVLFLSDNGGNPFDFNRTPQTAPGPAESFRSYDSKWAQVSNTPFRRYKRWSHEGGIATPLIVRWPGEVEAGRVTDAVGHVIDLMPTLVEVTGARYPVAVQERTILPMEGESLGPVLEGVAAPRRGPLFWEVKGHRAVREGRWKLVAERGRSWELYDMAADRTELDDVLASHPVRAGRMARMYDRWARRVGAPTDDEARAVGPSRRAR